MNIKKKYNLKGQKFGEWEVLEEGEPYQNKTNTYTRRQWICKCSCGNIENVIEQNLISKKSVQCKRCHLKSRQKIIEIGKIYGKLKVIKEEEGQASDLPDAKKRWVCECQCKLHTTKSYQGAYLLNNNPRKCGKIGCDESKALLDDNGKISNKVCSYCGKMQPISKFRNERGEGKCLDCEPYKEFIPDVDLVSQRFSYYKRRARDKKLPFEFTREEFAELTSKNCFYCGEKTHNKNYCGLDRVDNTKGYIKENCVPCCGNCNTIKLDRDVYEWLDRIDFLSTKTKEIRQKLKERGDG